MRIIPFVLICLFLSACSNKKTEVQGDLIAFTTGIGEFSGSGTFGSVLYSDSKILTVKITNGGESSIAGPASLDNSNFSIISQYGCDTINVQESCFVKIYFDARNKPNLEYSVNLSLGEATINLTAQIIPKVNNTAFKYQISGAEVSAVNFGNVGKNQTVLKSISIVNTGNTAINDQVVLGAGYSLAFDNCSNRNLNPNKSCVLKVVLNGANKPLGAINESLSYSNNSLNVSASIVEPVFSGTADLVYLVNNQLMTELKMGLMDTTSTQQYVLTIKNIGSAPYNPQPLVVDQPSLSVGFDSCSNKTIFPNNFCQVRLNFTSVGKTPNYYPNLISLGNELLPVSGKVVDLCSELTTGELNSLGFNPDNATVLGKFPNCSLSCNLPLQELALDTKSCEDKVPEGSISFSNNFSNQTNNNQLNISSVNATSLQFYSDNTCSTTLGSPISLPASSTLINLSSGDGLKNVYAKFINGTKSSDCKTDSIELDTVANYSLTSSGIVERHNSNTLSFSGSCEANTATLNYQVLSLSESVLSSGNLSCDNGSYSATIATPVGSEHLKVSAVDLANNSFNQTTPILIYGNLAFNSNSINASAESGYTNLNNVSVDVSAVENAKEYTLSLSNSCSGTVSSFVSNPSIDLTINSLNNIYLKLKNGLTESNCILVGSLTHDNLAPILSSLSFENLQYGEAGFTPALNIPVITETNLKNFQLALSSDNISNNLVDWQIYINPVSALQLSASMQDKVTYYFRAKATDKAGNESSVSSLSFKHYQDYPFVALTDDGSGNKVLNNGSSKTNYLSDFVKVASSSAVKEEFSGVHNLKHFDTIISTELAAFDGGTYPATNYCNSTPDIMCMVRFNGDTILNGTHIPQVRKKGFVVYVNGNLTISAGALLSMSARGANAAGQQVYIHPLASIGPVGGNGALRFTASGSQAGTTVYYKGNDGATGSDGAGGGGGSGNAARVSTAYTSSGGAGSAGTSWSGGSGGGGAGARTGSASGGDAAPNGGAGGNGSATTDWVGFGGSGNPPGGGSGLGGTGTGGTLILIVKGDLIINGNIQANGVTSNTGGGSSGGGSISIVYGNSITGAANISASGGLSSLGNGNAWSGIGGAGSIRIIQASDTLGYPLSSCNAIKQQYPNALSGKYLIDLDGPGGTYTPFEALCDMTTDGGGWTNIAPVMGNMTNVMFGSYIRSNAGGGSPNPSLARMGITSSTTALNNVNGSLVSVTHPNGTCNIDYPSLNLTSEIVSLLNISKVKIQSKSYSGGGSAACGGMLAGATYTGVTTINPVGFNTRYLSTCSNNPGERWFEYTSPTEWHFSYTLGNLPNPVISTLYVNCGSGTSYIQIKSIMVK